MDPSKEEKPTSKISLLGTEVTIAQFHVEVNLPLKKRTEIIEDLAKILQKKRLTPAAAAKMQQDTNNPGC